MCKTLHIRFPFFQTWTAALHALGIKKGSCIRDNNKDPQEDCVETVNKDSSGTGTLCTPKYEALCSMLQ